MRTATWLALGAGLVLVLSLLLTPETLPAVSTCVFYRFTGVPCPGCGMTRAFCSLGHAEWRAAWLYHPLSYPLYAACWFAAAWPLVLRVRPAWARLARPLWLAAAVIGYLIVLLAFGVWRAWPLVAQRL